MSRTSELAGGAGSRRDRPPGRRVVRRDGDHRGAPTGGRRVQLREHRRPASAWESIAVAGGCLLIGWFGVRAAVLVGLAYAIVGGFFALLPWLVLTLGAGNNGVPGAIPEAVASPISEVYLRTLGPLNAVGTVGAAMLIAGLIGILRSLRRRDVGGLAGRSVDRARVRADSALEGHVPTSAVRRVELAGVRPGSGTASPGSARRRGRGARPSGGSAARRSAGAAAAGPRRSPSSRRRTSAGRGSPSGRSGPARASSPGGPARRGGRPARRARSIAMKNGSDGSVERPPAVRMTSTGSPPARRVAPAPPSTGSSSSAT